MSIPSESGAPNPSQAPSWHYRNQRLTATSSLTAPTDPDHPATFHNRSNEHTAEAHASGELLHATCYHAVSVRPRCIHKTPQDPTPTRARPSRSATDAVPPEDGRSKASRSRTTARSHRCLRYENGAIGGTQGRQGHQGDTCGQMAAVATGEAVEAWLAGRGSH